MTAAAGIWFSLWGVRDVNAGNDVIRPGLPGLENREKPAFRYIFDS
jgi:hypothetical protein